MSVWELSAKDNGEKTDGCWDKMHNEELHNLYSSQNINKMITSQRIKWAEHVALNKNKLRGLHVKY
jgi:hypothetical protein